MITIGLKIGTIGYILFLISVILTKTWGLDLIFIPFLIGCLAGKTDNHLNNL